MVVSQKTDSYELITTMESSISGETTFVRITMLWQEVYMRSAPAYDVQESRRKLCKRLRETWLIWQIHK